MAGIYKIKNVFNIILNYICLSKGCESIGMFTRVGHVKKVEKIWCSSQTYLQLHHSFVFGFFIVHIWMYELIIF
jgi:hypothetical protein